MARLCHTQVVKQGECGGIHVALNLSIESGPTMAFRVLVEFMTICPERTTTII